MHCEVGRGDVAFGGCQVEIHLLSEILRGRVGGRVVRERLRLMQEKSRRNLRP